MSAGRRGSPGNAAGPGDADARLVALNQQLATSLREAQDRVRTSSRLLDDMSRAMGPDTLTYLPNRVLLLDRVTQAVAVARLHHSRLAVLVVELGNLRMLAERFGKGSGNAILRAVAMRLRDALGTVETVSRHGNDRFIVLLPEVLLDETESVVQRILSALDAPLGVDDSLPPVTVGIGVAFFPDHGRSPLELIGSAECAARRAGETGDRAVVIFDRSMQPVASPSFIYGGDMPIVEPWDEAPPDVERSPLQVYMCEANEQLLMASLTSLDKKELAEQALRRQTDFLAVLAHELRTPLTPISVASAMMSDVEPDQIPRLQGVINRQIVHISRMLTDLLEVSRINAGKVSLRREVVSLVSVIHHVVDTCAPGIEARGQVFTRTLPKGPIRVFGDPVRLAQIFTNLLDNASRYTPERGTVRLAVEADETSVTVTVTDSGIGIAAETLPSVFEPFVQHRSAVAFNGAGLGIGLTVVRDMCEAHGGRVEAYSEGGDRGASFVVTLPRVFDAGSSGGQVVAAPP